MKTTSAALIFASAALFLSACSSQPDLDNVMGYWYLDDTKTCIVGKDYIDRDGLIDDLEDFSVVPCTTDIVREIEATRGRRS